MYYRISFFLVLIAFHCQAIAQNSAVTDSIVAEGKLIYTSELASWYGSDILLEKYRDLSLKAGGYFSYCDSGNTHCVIYSNAKNPVVLLTITFDKTFNKSTAKINTAQRAFSANENDLFLLRSKAMEIARKDTLFKIYQNSKLNLIPLNEGGKKRVYFLTGPSQGGVVIFGNDYLINFDDLYNATEIKSLHQNIMPFYYKEDDIGAMHSHTTETGDYITATDICTLLLYERYTSWKEHIVISDKLVSIWNIPAEELTVMPRENWEESVKQSNHENNP